MFLRLGEWAEARFATPPARDTLCRWARGAEWVIVNTALLIRPHNYTRTIDKRNTQGNADMTSNLFKTTRTTTGKFLGRDRVTERTEYWYDLGNNQAIRLRATTDEEAQDAAAELDEVTSKFKGGAAQWWEECGKNNPHSVTIED